MTDRILDISEESAKLRVRYDQLLIEREGKQETTIPLNEIAALAVSNPLVSYSHAVLAGLAKAGAVLVVCDEKHMPAAIMAPITGHFVQAERFELQAAATLPLKKRLWQQIVSAKISAQGRLLAELRGADLGLREMAKRVKSGDPENLEAQASRRYWPALFNDQNFRRDHAKEDQNRFLNYAYAVLRAIVARAVCAAGLHPSLGLHHHNRYDAFCLADDLMEPFRPLVDNAVVKIVEEKGPLAPMDKQTKAALLAPLTSRHELHGESRTLFDLTAKTASSLANIFLGKSGKLLLPQIVFNPKEAAPQNEQQ